MPVPIYSQQLSPSTRGTQDKANLRSPTLISVPLFQKVILGFRNLGIGRLQIDIKGILLIDQPRSGLIPRGQGQKPWVVNRSDQVTKELNQLKEKVNLLKGGQSNPQNSLVDRDPSFIESITYERLPEQYQTLKACHNSLSHKFVSYFQGKGI